MKRLKTKTTTTVRSLDTESLSRVQGGQETQNKFVEMVSNIVKAAHDMASGVVQNLRG